MNKHSIILLVCLSLCLLVLSDRGMLLAQPPAPVQEIYQDFRNRRPLLDSFHLGGPDLDGETKAEDAGLRIKLNGMREHHWPVEVAANFDILGDFEITGTYELLSAKRPIKGYGVGVHLNIGDTNERKVFAKVCRVMDVGRGSVYLTEHWNKDQPDNNYQTRFERTETKLGQLRLVRIGTSLRYLVADTPGKEFRGIWFQKDFGAADLEHFRFGVADSGEPGNPVEARLIDLRIRMGTVTADKAFAPAPLAEPAPPPPGAEAEAPGTKNWILLTLVLGLGVALTAATGLGVLLILRRRRPAETPPSELADKFEAAVGPVLVLCGGCGKKLKVRTEMAGKKIKCTQCGKAVPVPAT